MLLYALYTEIYNLVTYVFTGISQEYSRRMIVIFTKSIQSTFLGLEQHWPQQLQSDIFQERHKPDYP